MKNLFSKLLLVAALLLPTTATAYDFLVDELAYNINEDGNSVSVTYVEYLDSNYSGLTTADISETVTYDGKTYSVTSIGDYAFYGCTELTSVTIPNSIISIGKQAFSACFNLTNIIIPNSVTSIGSSAFSQCKGLTNVTIPNSVTSIGSWAFFDCRSLTNITIPNSVTEISAYLFYECI